MRLYRGHMYLTRGPDPARFLLGMKPVVLHIIEPCSDGIDVGLTVVIHSLFEPSLALLEHVRIYVNDINSRLPVTMFLSSMIK